VVLFFYPRDLTFICPTELQALGALHAEFGREGAAVLAASTDSFFSHKAWYEGDSRLRGIGYPVLADTAQTMSRDYGVLLPDGAALRGTFIIDPEGVVRHIQINDLSVGRSPEETLRTLRALKTGELCPVSWKPGQPTLSGATAAAA